MRNGRSSGRPSSYLQIFYANIAAMSMRQRRIIAVFITSLVFAAAVIILSWQSSSYSNTNLSQATPAAGQTLASSALAKLSVKGRAPFTNYNRDKFASDWETIDGCDMRERILNRDLTSVHDRSTDDCTVLSGTLNDPYTGHIIRFVRGVSTSGAVQIDHVVAIGDAWQTGAQQLSLAQRYQLYNDPLELLAVDGPTNEQKGDGDAAIWLPPNKAYRCRYVARQIAVKLKYNLWVTRAEHNAMVRLLSSCPAQVLPVPS